MRQRGPPRPRRAWPNWPTIDLARSMGRSRRTAADALARAVAGPARNALRAWLRRCAGPAGAGGAGRAADGRTGRRLRRAAAGAGTGTAIARCTCSAARCRLRRRRSGADVDAGRRAEPALRIDAPGRYALPGWRGTLVVEAGARRRHAAGPAGRAGTARSRRAASSSRPDRGGRRAASRSSSRPPACRLGARRRRCSTAGAQLIFVPASASTHGRSWPTAAEPDRAELGSRPTARQSNATPQRLGAARIAGFPPASRPSVGVVPFLDLHHGTHRSQVRRHLDGLDRAHPQRRQAGRQMGPCRPPDDRRSVGHERRDQPPARAWPRSCRRPTSRARCSASST